MGLGMQVSSDMSSFLKAAWPFCLAGIVLRASWLDSAPSLRCETGCEVDSCHAADLQPRQRSQTPSLEAQRLGFRVAGSVNYSGCQLMKASEDTSLLISSRHWPAKQHLSVLALIPALACPGMEWGGPDALLDQARKALSQRLWSALAYGLQMAVIGKSDSVGKGNLAS